MSGNFTCQRNEREGHIYFVVYQAEPYSEDVRSALEIIVRFIEKNFDAQTCYNGSEQYFSVNIDGDSVRLHLDEGLGLVYLDAEEGEVTQTLERVARSLKILGAKT